MKELLEKYNIKPSKKLGQNFLVNQGIIEKIIKSAEIKEDEIILEIGPGLGVLTRELAKKAQKVITIEKDPKLVELLKEELKDFKNVEIINEDILKTSRVPSSGRFKVVANLPFNIATAIIQKFLEADNKPSEMILMVQKEVAQRICAKPPKMSILAVSVQFYSDPKILFHISRGSFWPTPKVDSSILQIKPFDKPGLSTPDFFKIVKTGFAHPRKQLGSNLPKELLLKAGLDPKRRAETLTVEDWVNLTQTYPQ
jgi:16S rRNA (adenine1518-N6/adenine1519-N6)-dimethyltransferase